MTKTKLTMPATIVMVSIFLASCNSPARKVEIAKEEVVDAKADLKEANQEYLEDMRAYRKQIASRIEANDKNIATLKQKELNVTTDAKREYKTKMEQLEKKNLELKKRLADYNDEGIDNWKSFKSEFNRDMDVLGKALKDLTIKNE